MKDPSREKLIIKEPKCWEYLLYNNKVQILLVLLLCAFIGIGTPFIWQQIWKTESKCCNIESDLRYNCYPQKPNFKQNKTECKLENCCWDDEATDDQIKCYYGIVTNDQQKLPGYKIEQSNANNATLIVDRFPRYLNKSDSPPVIKRLQLTVQRYTECHFRIRIGPQDQPEHVDHSNYLRYEHLMHNDSIDINAIISWPQRPKDDFTISVRRKQTNQLIFNTGDYSPFIYSEGLIEITTLLPNDLIFGLGQSPSKSFKHNLTYPQNWAIFNKHHLNLTNNQSSWFGSHPFYMGLEGDGNAYGILLLNTYPIEIITNSRPSLTFRTVGGYLDFHFFMGPKPMDVIQQLSGLIGHPSLPPYWALGFHLCRTICDPLDGLDILERVISNSVPVESDCGSAALSTIFSSSTVPLKNFYESKITTGVKRVVVQVPQKLSESEAISEMKMYNFNKLREVHKRWFPHSLKYPDGSNFTGYFYDWCGDSPDGTKSVIFPNFFGEKNPIETEHVEVALLEDLNDLDLPGGINSIDGLILDYNTPLDLSYTRNEMCPSSSHDDEWNNYYYSKLNEGTPCLDLSLSTNFSDNENLASVHNLYGYQHTRVVNTVLSRLSKKRRLIMSSSTFIGSGYFGGHLGGSMNASWDMLRQTIIQTLEFSMYGIPLTGFPVCGFTGWSKDQELCLRWYQLAALQPFMISHRGLKEKLTDPISVSNKDNKTLEAIKSSITIRYQLLPYLYTLFYRANQAGEMVLRPLFFEYPDDRKTYKIDKQFLWGSALLISPVTESGVKSVKAYFPEGNWYDFYSGRRVANRKKGYIDLSAVGYHANLHIKGGCVIPTQDSAKNTVESRKNNFTLIAALDSHGGAKGELFLDDGETTVSGQFLLSHFSFVLNKHTSIQEISIQQHPDSSTAWIKEDMTNTKIDVIRIFGVIHPPIPETISPNKTSFNYDDNLGVLTFKGLELDLRKNHTLSWNYKEWGA